MATRKKAAPAETEVVLTATPSTEVTIEAGPKSSASAPHQPNSIIQAIKQNPIPAGMVWLGVGWLMLARSRSQQSQGDQRQSPTADVASKAEQTLVGVMSTTQQSVGNIGTATQQSVGKVVTTVQESVGAVSGRARTALTQAQSLSTTAASAARDRASEVAGRATVEASNVVNSAQRLLTERPLAMEVGAVAAGALAGLALPETKPEQQLLTPARQRLMPTMDEVGEQTVAKVEQVVSQNGAPATSA